MFTSIQESQEFCEDCRKFVLVRRIVPNHWPHLFFSLLCCGWWVVVWFVIALSGAFKPFRCTRCGLEISASRSAVWAVLLFPLIMLAVPILFVVVLIAMGGISAMLSPSKPVKDPENAVEMRPVDKVKVDIEPRPKPKEKEPDAGEKKVEPKKADPKVEPKPVVEPVEPKESPKPKRPTDAEILAARKAAYIKIAAAIAGVEAAAEAKKLKSGSIPHKVFMDNEIPKALSKLAAELGQDRSTIDSIRSEGDEKKWPKK